MVRYCLETLQIWFDAIGFIDEVNVKAILLYLQGNDFSLPVSHHCSYISYSLLQIK